jgi:hypothetical protein
MEMTPQEIDAARLAAEIDRQVRHSMLSPRAANALEKRALALHPPPLFRVTQPVPAPLRQAEVEMLKPLRSPKRKKHVLP